MKTSPSPTPSHQPGSVLSERLYVPPVDPRRLRFLFPQWEPERPELLVRLRPRLSGVRHG